MPPLGAGASFAYFRLEGVGVAVQTRLDGLLPVLLVRQVVVAVGTVAVVAKLSIGKAVAVTTGKKKFSYGKKKFSYGKKKFSYGKKKFSYGKKKFSYGKKKFSYGKKKFSYGKKKFSYGKKKFSYCKKKFSYGKKKFSTGKKKFSYGKKKFSYGKTQVQCTIASKINVTPKVFICPFRSHTRF